LLLDKHLGASNGLLRQYFPKSTDLSRHTPRDLARVEHELNSRPRMILADRTPAELFEELLASQKPPAVAMTDRDHPVAMASSSSVVNTGGRAAKR